MMQHLTESTAAVNCFSIERLIRLAFQYRLITDYRMTPTLIQLYHEDGVFEMDPELTRRLLCRLVRRAMSGEGGRGVPTEQRFHQYA